MFSTSRFTPRPTRRTRRRAGRHRTVSAAGVAAAGLLLATGPAATAAPASYTHGFIISYGASYVIGEATFTNRSVILDGTLHAVGCGRVVLGNSYAGPDLSDHLGSGSSTPRCSGDWSIHVPVPADKPGGADRVLITLVAPDGSASDWVRWVR